MKKNLKCVSLGLSLALVLGLTSCSTPNSPTGNLEKNPSVTQNPANSLSTQPQNAITGTASSQQATNEIISYYDDESTFSDSENLANQESGFSTKASSEPAEVKKTESETPTATKTPSPEETPSPAKTSSPVPNLTATPSPTKTPATAETDKPGEKPEQRHNQKDDIKKRIDDSGAIIKNTDGTLKIDKDKLKTTLKEFIDDNKVEIENHNEKVKNELKEKKEIDKNKTEKLKNKDAKTKSSNVVETPNADKSITKTVSFEFKTDNITKEDIVSKTTKDGKVVSISHSLKSTAKDFTKNASRIITINADGSKKVVTESIATYTDNKKIEVHETRDIDVKGIGAGTGTITVTDKDGKTTTKNLDTKVRTSSSGEEKVTSTQTDGNKKVTLDEDDSGKATVEVKDGDKTTEKSEVKTI